LRLRACGLGPEEGAGHDGEMEGGSEGQRRLRALDRPPKGRRCNPLIHPDGISVPEF
jgi:hypothetical protein